VEHRIQARFVSGHDFSRAEPAHRSIWALQAAEKLVKCVSKRRFVSGHDFSRAKTAHRSIWALQAAGKLVVLKGHDFSRAKTAHISIWALAPEGCFPGVRIKSCPFPAACGTSLTGTCPQTGSMGALAICHSLKSSRRTANRGSDAVPCLTNPRAQKWLGPCLNHERFPIPFWMEAPKHAQTCIERSIMKSSKNQ